MSYITISNIPIILLMIGSSLLYFGKVISEFKPQKFEKLDLYFEGFKFFLRYTGLPLTILFILGYRVSFTFQELFFIPISHNIALTLTSDVIFIIPILAIYLFYSMESIPEKDHIKYAIWNRKHPGQNGETYLKYLTSDVSMTIVSFVLLFSLMLLAEGRNLPMIMLGSLFVFFTYTKISILYAYKTARYPKIKITFLNHKKIYATLYREHEDFLTVNLKDKFIMINKNNIETIEMG